MAYIRHSCVLAAFVFFMLFSANVGLAQGSAPEIAYTVSMSKPNTHLLEVETNVKWSGRPPEALDLVMPVWTPGSYLVREYARHVQDFAAKDPAGRPLQWRKASKNTWRVDIGTAREVNVSYNVYSNELTVRTNEFNDRHAFWNNAALLMYPDGHLGRPSTVRVVPREGWKIATGLPTVSGASDTFRAENYDLLYDSPFLVSDFKTLTFSVSGVPHRIIVDGRGNYDLEKLRRDVQRVVEASVTLMRDIPYRDYTFLLMTSPTAGGGLEHLNSTALITSRFGFKSEAGWRGFLTLVAHEYFHLWNVKRIRPDALGPFDYTRENYTRLLWVAEGVTSYYENLIVRRAGLMTDKQFLESNARAFQTLQDTPGRLEVSLEEASFDAWIKHYRPDENTVNSTISYYSKGAIVGLLLDLEIRKHSRGERSLDDAMRFLYEEFFKKNRNYTPEDFQKAAERSAGTSLESFFDRYVRGREELNYNDALAVVGLRLDSDKVSTDQAFLGATLAQEGDRLVVRNVPAGSPAYEHGLYALDQIVAIDGARAASRDFLDARLGEKRPGDMVVLTVFRGDELREFSVRLGARPSSNYRIVPVSSPSTEQTKNYESWLGAPFPKG